MAARSPFSFVVAVCLVPTGLQAVEAAQTGPLAAATDALQVLADLTLIDGSCPADAVNFGVVFRFTSEQGVPEVAMMPGGARRSAFEAALRARRASFDKDELCGEIAENYAEALPGSVSFRPGTGLRP